MGGLRVLIMCADGAHLSAAHSLASQLEDRPEIAAVDLTEVPSVLAFRPGSAVVGALPGRARTLALAALGHRGLARTITRFRADVVICESPAVGAALAQLARLGRFPLSLISLTTDPAALEDLAHPGAPIAVQPLVDPRFLDPPSRGAARAHVARQLQITLKGGRPLVLISGGAAGTGDLTAAVKTTVARAPEAAIAVICGHNADAEAELGARFTDTPQVRVIGFSRRMPTLLAAADVVVHRAGGTTEIEARLIGCPLVDIDSELGPALDRALAGGRQAAFDVSELPRAADVVIALAQ